MDQNKTPSTDKISTSITGRTARRVELEPHFGPGLAGVHSKDGHIDTLTVDFDIQERRLAEYLYMGHYAPSGLLLMTRERQEIRFNRKRLKRLEKLKEREESRVSVDPLTTAHKIKPAYVPRIKRSTARNLDYLHKRGHIDIAGLRCQVARKLVGRLVKNVFIPAEPAATHAA